MLIALRAGEALGDHGVKESALLARARRDGARRSRRRVGRRRTRATLFQFEPDERHSVTSDAGARLLLLLAPWPGEGHYRGDRPAGSGVSAS